MELRGGERRSLTFNRRWSLANMLKQSEGMGRGVGGKLYTNSLIIRGEVEVHSKFIPPRISGSLIGGGKNRATLQGGKGKGHISFLWNRNKNVSIRRVEQPSNKEAWTRQSLEDWGCFPSICGGERRAGHSRGPGPE